ncbi:hypothetical protein HZC00_00520 [Candidatus Kaiserbacteria bacterium]|nr:hypothetical protein [Candidatus Kaiserbacteria bacterium]
MRIRAIILSVLFVCTFVSTSQAKEGPLSLYVGNISAERETQVALPSLGDIKVTATCWGNGHAYSRAHSLEEAQRLGMDFAKQKFPESDGWKNHKIDLELVPKEFLAPIFEDKK